MLEELRRRLISLYADLAAHTKPKCTSRCKRPFQRCEERYCVFAIEFARDDWGVDLQPSCVAKWGSLLTEELPSNQIEHKLFGFLANEILSHFFKFLMSIVEYYLIRRRCFSHRGRIPLMTVGPLHERATD
jgi:hypothetical protein